MLLTIRQFLLFAPRGSDPAGRAPRRGRTDVPGDRGNSSVDPQAPLLARVRAGDVGAFEVVYREHVTGLIAFVHGFIADRAVAEEIVQSVFFGVWTRRADIRIETTVRAYLYTAARYQAVDHLRRRALERRVLDAEHTDDVAASDTFSSAPSLPDARAERNALSHAARAAIAELPERSRQAFLLSRGQGLTYPEIAVVLGISVKAVEALIGRSLRSLREALAPYFRE